MKKTYVEPAVDVIKFAMNETITTDDEAWMPGFSTGVEKWD